MNDKDKSYFAKIILASVIFVCFLAVLGLTADLVKNKRELKPQPQSLVSPEFVSYPNCKTKNKVFFEIKELGIKFLVDKSIKNDVIYNYSGLNKNELGGIKLSAFSLLLMDTHCSTDEGPLGKLIKIKGTPNDPGNEYYLDKTNFIKQFDSFFVYYSMPQETCASLYGKDLQKTKEYESQLKTKINFNEDLKCIDVTPGNIIPSQIIGWQTFQSKKYGYEISFPNDWNFHNSGAEASFDRQIFLNISSESHINIIGIGGYITLNVFDGLNIETVDEWKKRMKVFAFLPEDNEINFGEKGVVAEVFPTIQSPGSVLNYIVHDAKGYELELLYSTEASRDADIIAQEKILSTFKFTN